MLIDDKVVSDIEKDFRRELLDFMKNSSGFGKFNYAVNFSNGKKTNTKIALEKTKK